MTDNKKSLVIVDDSPVILTLMKKIVQDVTADIFFISDFQEAMEHCTNNKVDILITDLNIDNYNGFDLIKACQSNPLNESLSSFVMSAESVKEHKEMVKERKVKGWIVKPLEPNSLRSIINKFIEK